MYETTILSLYLCDLFYVVVMSISLPLFTLFNFAQFLMKVSAKLLFLPATVFVLTPAPFFYAWRVYFQKRPRKALHNDKLLDHEET